MDHRRPEVNRRALVTVCGAATLAPLIAAQTQAQSGPQRAMTEDALQQMRDLASGSPTAPSILNKLDKDGGNLDDAAALRTALGADLAANVNFTPTGPNAVTRSTAQVLDDFIRITDDGAAGTGSGDDSRDIQSVIDKVRAADRPGNILGVPGKNYRITSPLVLKRGVRLDLNGATITAAYDNAPVVKLDSDAQSHSWGIENGILTFASQQSTAHTDSAAVQASGAGVNSYMGSLRNLTLQNANCGIKGPAASGSFTFLLHADNILIVNNSGWAVDIDSRAGGNTNLNFENILSTQSSGSNSANKGFRIRNCAGLLAKNLNVDQAKGQVLFCENTFGAIGHLAFEGATFNAANGDNENYPILLSNCGYMRIGTLYSYSSTFATRGTDIVIVRAGDSRLWLDNYVLSSITQDTSGGGTVYHAQAVSSGLIRNDYFAASTGSEGRPVAANLADLGTVKSITRWNGVERTTSATWPVAADNAAAGAGGLSRGEVYQTPTGELRIVV